MDYAPGPMSEEDIAAFNKLMDDVDVEQNALYMPAAWHRNLRCDNGRPAMNKVLVLGWLVRANRMKHDNSDIVFVDVPAMVDMYGLSRTVISKAVKWLEGKGYLHTNYIEGRWIAVIDWKGLESAFDSPEETEEFRKHQQFLNEIKRSK